MAKHREPGLADQLPWPFARTEEKGPGPEPERFGGDNYEVIGGSGWFKPWVLCPSCAELLIAWTDKALIEKMEKHCKETGCVMPKL
jgi:hypothetical protein